MTTITTTATMAIATTTTDTTTGSGWWFGIGALLASGWLLLVLRLAWNRRASQSHRCEKLAGVLADCDDLIRANEKKIALLRGVVRSRQAVPPDRTARLAEPNVPDRKAA